MSARAIRARAPGKIVLWGEYAVLAGAPALVMAVDRYATCELVPATGSPWALTAAGHTAAAATVSRARLTDEAAAPADGAIDAILRQVLRALPAERLPPGGRAHFDTAGFHHEGHKLGLGSSAALTVATYGAVCRLLGLSAAEESAHAIHRAFQGGSGSGIDVAAAWHGGTLRFRRADAGAAPEVTPWPLPSGLTVRSVWTGSAARTGAHLGRLQCWLNRGGGRELDELTASADGLFHAADPLAALSAYTDRLDALDRAAELGIFSPPHRHLQRLAIAAGVVYKPCGAGGGDIGAAFAADAAAIEQFIDLARQAGYLPLALETASHGLEVTG